MSIYIGLIAYIILLPTLIKPLYKDKDKANKIIAFWGMLAIFLIFALKAETVGIDIAGYSEQYRISARKSWGNNDYVYFETGYIILQKIFSKAGFSFQFFTVVIYFVLCLAVYLLIKNYSKDASFSMLIFVCYQFFVFSISGLRQALATGICIFAFLLLSKGKVKCTVVTFVLYGLAITIHQSSLIFGLVIILYFTSKRRKYFNALLYLPIILFSFVLRPYIWQFVDTYMRDVDSQTQVELRGNFAFLIGITLFMAFTISKFYKGFILKREINDKSLIDEYKEDAFLLRMAFMSIIANIVFSGGALLRSAMYFTIFLLISIPNLTNKWDTRSKTLLKTVMCLFLIILFYVDTLNINQLELCPYKFYWE